MNRNVPKLRFKGFEDEWEKIHLSDRVERVVRKNKGNITNRPLTISAQYGLVNQEEFFNKVVASKNLEGYYLLNNGEFAYNKSYSNGYPFGAIKRLDKYKNGAVSTLYICFKPKLNVDSDFLTQYFESSKWYREVSMVAVEGARNHGLLNIGVSDFFDTIHRFPSLQEQEKIANFLSKVDSIIEKQEKKVEYWNSYKKGMMQKIFKQEIRFKDENGMDYPEWKINKIENIATIEMGFTPSTKNDEAWNGNIDWLSIAGMNSKYIYSGNKKISSEILGKRKLVPIDTLIMSFKLTIGRLAIVKKDIVTNEAICQFYWKSKDISNEYMYAYLSVINIQSFGCRAAKGITLNTESLNSIVVKLPCLEEQTKIANFLSNIDNIIEKESKKLEELKQWKKGLLQQMFV